MINQNKKKILKSYYIGSAVVIILWILFGLIPSLFSPLSSTLGQDIDLVWSDYLSIYFGFLFFPAIYGLFSGLLIDRVEKKAGTGRLYFLGASLLGILFVLISWVGGELSRIDCRENCVGSIPTQFASNFITLLLVPVLIGIPAYLTYYFFRFTNSQR